MEFQVTPFRARENGRETQGDLGISDFGPLFTNWIKIMNYLGFILVGTGGFIGSVLRYGMSLWITQRSNVVFPLATLLVNIIGSFLIGLIAGASMRTSVPENVRLFLSTGICGGFTTFSAFSVENLKLLQAGSYGMATFYILLSICCGLIAVALGFLLAKQIF